MGDCHLSGDRRTLHEGEAGLVVVSVNGSAGADYILKLARQGVSVLMETPPSVDIGGLLELNEQISRIDGAKVQVAEQYPYYPMQAARLKVDLFWPFGGHYRSNGFDLTSLPRSEPHPQNAWRWLRRGENPSDAFRDRMG